MSINIPHAHSHDEEIADTKIYGFWLYIMTDCIMFATVFAVYAVLMHNTAGGPSAKELFNLPFVLVETAALLISSITCGMATIAAYSKNDAKSVIKWLVLTFIFGLIFICLEVYEFNALIQEGAGPQRSGFLSGYFSLVGMHGLHVTAGLIWSVFLILQFKQKGATLAHKTRLTLFGLFWHFLDIVWICVFSVVYLIGAA